MNHRCLPRAYLLAGLAALLAAPASPQTLPVFKATQLEPCPALISADALALDLSKRRREALGRRHENKGDWRFQLHFIGGRADSTEETVTANGNPKGDVTLELTRLEFQVEAVDLERSPGQEEVVSDETASIETSDWSAPLPEALSDKIAVVLNHFIERGTRLTTDHSVCLHCSSIAVITPIGCGWLVNPAPETDLAGLERLLVEIAAYSRSPSPERLDLLEVWASYLKR